MGLPARPKIQLLIGPCVPGKRAEGVVVLESNKAFRLDALYVHIRGREFAADAVTDFLLRGSELTGARTFNAGQHRLPFSFGLSWNCPPSQTGSRSGITYHAEVHADVPWWPDRRASFLLQVVANPLVRPETMPPRVYHSLPAGAPSSEPHLELSLASGSVAVGDELHGAIAGIGCGHLGEFRIALESTVRWNSLVVERGPKLLAALDSLPEEGMAPFRLKVPADTPLTLSQARPDRQGALTRLWRIEVSAGVGRRAMKLSAPIELHGGPRAEASRIPVVGESRIDSVWAGAAEASGFVFEGGALQGRDGEVDYRVQRERVEGRGVIVTTSLRYPHLGFDVRVQPLHELTLLDRMRTERLTKWCALQTRDLEQTQRAFEPLVPMFKGCLVSLDDERCRLEFPDGGTDPIKLHSTLAQIRKIASGFQALTLALPPPTGMEHVVPAWRELATRLHSSLCVGDLHISCARGAVHVSVRARFDVEGLVLGTLIHGHPADGASLPLGGVEQGEDARTILAAHIDGELLERGVRAAQDSEARLGPNGLALTFDWRFGEPGADGCEALLSRVEDVHRVVAALASGERGPYR